MTKTILRSKGIIFIILSLTLISINPTSGGFWYDVNVVGNPGFETGSLQPWQVYYVYTCIPSVQSGSYYRHSGSYGLRLTHYDPSGPSYCTGALTTQDIYAKASYVKEISFWHKHPGAGVVTLTITYTDGTTDAQSWGETYDYQDDPPTWRQEFFNLGYLDSGKIIDTIKFQFNSPYSTGMAVAVDDVRLIESRYFPGF